jgi:hypothetical protein
MRGSVEASLVALLLSPSLVAAAGMDFAHLAALRRVDEAVISPVDEDGRAWRELHVVSVHGGDARAWVHGDVGVNDVRYASVGTALYYRAKLGDDEHESVWSLPVGGG